MQKPSVLNTNFKKKIYCAIIILASFLCSYFLTDLFRAPYTMVKNNFNDLLFKIKYKITGKEEISPYLLHVVLDDTTIQKLNLPLWDRSIYGRVIRILSDVDTAAIACDIFFQFDNGDEKDNLLLTAASDSKQAYFPVILLPTAMTGPSEISTELNEKFIWRPVLNNRGNPHKAEAALLPFNKLSNHAKGLGHINSKPDPDGIIRRIPLLYAYKDGFIPALSLKVICDYLGVTPGNIIVTFGETIRLKDAKIPGRRKKDILIPIDNRAQLILDFVGPWIDSFIPFPVEKLLAAETDKKINTHLYDVMHDSVVILSNVSTNNKDYGTNTFDAVYPLSGIHLTIANMLLTENFIQESSFIEETLMAVALIIILWLFTLFRKARVFFIGTGIIFILIIVFKICFFLFFQQLFTVIPTLFGTFFSFTCILVFYTFKQMKLRSFLQGKFITEKEKRFFQNQFILSITKQFQKPLQSIAETLQPTTPGQETIRQNINKLFTLLEKFLELVRFNKKDKKTSEQNIKKLSEYTKKKIILFIADKRIYQKTIAILSPDYTLINTENKEQLANTDPDLFIINLSQEIDKTKNFVSDFKKQKETSGIPLLLISDLEEQEISAPIDGLLPTHFSDVQLKIVIKNLLKLTEQQRELKSYKKQLEQSELKEKNIIIEKMSKKILKPQLEHPEFFIKIITQSNAMLQLFHFIEAIAGTSDPFLIMGESGVGKELLAEAVHKASGRKGKYVKENIGSMNSELISDTLFGHKEGAFTGSGKVRKGLIETASEGTLFLDEIGDMPLTTQTKLLRLLQENEYYALGSDDPRRARARFVFATNKNIKELIHDKSFREDLYHRFTFEITIPPLRDRREDLPLLISHFINKHAQNKKLIIPEELNALLSQYTFPGNIRELENMIRKAINLNKSNTLSIEPFVEHVNNSSINKNQFNKDNILNNPSKNLPTLKDVEETAIKKALEKAGGRQNIAAQLLGISPSNLNKKLKKYRIKNK